MNTITRYFLLTVLVCNIQIVHAAQWTLSSLGAAKKQVSHELEQFIQSQKPGTLLAEKLDQPSRAHLMRIMKFNTTSAPSIASLSTLQNKAEVFHWLSNKFYGSSKIPYAALALEHAPSHLQPSYAIDLYESIITNDEDSAAFAFDQLADLSIPAGTELMKRYNNLQRYYGFNQNTTTVTTTQDRPEICLHFSLNVRKSPAQNWESLITVTPKPESKWAYKGDTLCFFGKWKTRYQLNTQKTLQSSNRLTLPKARNETIYSGMRSPMIRFSSTGSVLNAHGTKNIGIETANIDRVNVTLWQIPANNLSNQEVKAIISSPQHISNWEFNEKIQREAVKLFQGSFAIGSYVANKTITSNVFLDDLTKNTPIKAGIYVLSAVDSDDEYNTSHLAFGLSNMGFSTYLTPKGLWAELRDLKTAQPAPNQQVKLYSRNNTLLGTAQTNSQGVAHFNKAIINGSEGLTPDHISSSDGNIFAYLVLNKKAIDLSDKGLSGTITQGPLQSWIWTDRGIYRPRDTAHMMWLLKTPHGKPFSAAPVWLRLTRPDGKTFLEKKIHPDESGAYSFDHYFSNTARQGNWTANIYLGKPGSLAATLISQKTIPVAAITPQQIEVAITSSNTTLESNSSVTMNVQADWLYGAPANGLTSSITHTISEQPHLIPSWSNWHIGLHDETVFSHTTHSDAQATADNGSSDFTFTLDNLPVNSKPLGLSVTAEVTEPSGQVVTAQYKHLIERSAPYIALQASGNKTINIALIDNYGKKLSGSANWELYRVNYDYYWYKKDGNWQYQHNENRQHITQGTISVSDDKPSSLELPLDDGAWVVVVKSGDSTQTVASLPLEYGRYAKPMVSSAPDKITIRSNKERFAHGETIALQLLAPFNGTASVKLAHNDTIIKNHLLDFTNGKAELSLTWDKAWNQGGLWLLANAWLPQNTKSIQAHNRRAMGLHWIGGDLSPYTLDITMDIPKHTLPERALRIPLQIPTEQLQDGGQTWIRVAAIDDGLYRLAKASFTSPLSTFFGKKQLNIEFFDTWGNIIKQVTGRQAALRSGAGDEESTAMNALQALPELDLLLVTFWSVPVDIDSNGNASVSVDIPQFNGRLRIMAAAWNNKRLGTVEKTINISAPLVATLYSPPYLSPADSSNIRLRLHNTTDTSMTITASLTASDSTRINMPPISERITLKANEVRWVNNDFYVSATTPNTTIFSATITGDESITLAKTVDIRPQTLPQKSQQMTTVRAGETKTIPTPQGNYTVINRTLFASTSAPFDVQRIVKELSIYPYSCTEQTTSKAWNNLLLSTLIKQYTLNDNNWDDADERIANISVAQSRLANRQNSDGGFSLWGHSESEVWLTSYVVEFLLSAQADKQLSNPSMLNSALEYLRKTVFAEHASPQEQAYALYVLAHAGIPAQGATVRFAEKLLNNEDLNSLLTLNNTTLHTVSALITQGELTLASNVLSQALQQTTVTTLNTESHTPYGSFIRDNSQGLTTLYKLQKTLKHLGTQGPLEKDVDTATNYMWEALQGNLATTHTFSTQELQWLSVLASNLPTSNTQSSQTTDITVDGKNISLLDTITIPVAGTTPITVTNTGPHTIYATTTTLTAARGEETAVESSYISADTTAGVVENGYTIDIRYENALGNPIDINNMAINDQVTVIITVTPNKELTATADLIFVYPLPAGVTTLSSSHNIEKNSHKEWFNTLLPAVFTEHRDDRYIAAFRTTNNKQFTHAFVLRAARKGTWNAPAYSIENMYTPKLRAQYPSPTVTVQ